MGDSGVKEKKKTDWKNLKKNKPEEQQKNPTNCSNVNSTAKRKRKEVAIFGNYRNYYGYRIGKDLEEDPRLKIMKKEWFLGKDCLDIGCNSGIITITIAQKFSCNSILGIDIDGDRVEDAKWTLRKIVRTSKKNFATDKSVAVEEGNQPENRATKSQSASSSCDSECSTTPAGRDLFDIVSFEKGNFVRNWSSPADKLYDTIICLSVTKWIHLNWGDDGLITLFSKVWKLLQPGGVFIVEPQPWTSYSNNRQVSETATKNYQNIEIGPGDFQEILLDKIGFRRVEHINPSLSKGKAGFNRPILAFWK